MIDRLEELLMMAEENDNQEDEVLPLGGVVERTAPPGMANVESEEKPVQLEQKRSVTGAMTDEVRDSESLNGNVVPQGTETAWSTVSQPPIAPAMKTNHNLRRTSWLIRSPGAIQAGTDDQESEENAHASGPADSGHREAAEPGLKENQTTGGLEELYRAATWAADPLGQMGTGWEPMAMMASEPARPEGRKLTVGELDRAVRRDSRRYDGGMTIF